MKQGAEPEKLQRSSIETRSLPALARCFPRSFTFYVADPISSIVSRLLPQRSTATSRLCRPCRSSRSLHCGMWKVECGVERKLGRRSRSRGNV